MNPPDELNTFLEDNTFVPELSSRPKACDFLLNYEDFKQDVRLGMDEKPPSSG